MTVDLEYYRICGVLKCFAEFITNTRGFILRTLRESTTSRPAASPALRELTILGLRLFESDSKKLSSDNYSEGLRPRDFIQAQGQTSGSVSNFMSVSDSFLLYISK